jgi:2',3'-cyclic-nucleotide 2'-phosphodiesterase (5'-nucleotidase family)
VVIVDAGDALLANHLMPPTEGELNKAETIMRGQGVIGVDAMGVGEAEIAVGTARLTKLARQTGQTLLCANLVQRGRNPFKPRRLLDTGGVKVGVFAVLEPFRTETKALELLRKAGVRTTDPEAAARTQVQALQREGAELIVMLAHVGMVRARELARKVKGIHLVVVGHTGHQYPVPVHEGETFLVEAGRRGQQLGHLQVRLGSGWTADQQLTDDSERQALYQDAQREIERLRQQHQRVPIPATDPRLLRIKGLADRLKTVRPPAAKHTLVNAMVLLDNTQRDHAGILSMIEADRASWRKGARTRFTRRARVLPLRPAPKRVERIERIKRVR